ncbi:hypothetical protein [Bacillus sp. FJAT-45066]|uniref:hypothetical protein n=1 Tax=Bacillus sp. FJAT-45066 TaxID=2011010 RepID=UPI000BB7DCA7|nr:hypothetical protein [Bacillus sp. FJAT-45066]
MKNIILLLLLLLGLSSCSTSTTTQEYEKFNVKTAELIITSNSGDSISPFYSSSTYIYDEDFPIPEHHKADMEKDFDVRHGTGASLDMVTEELKMLVLKKDVKILNPFHGLEVVDFTAVIFTETLDPVKLLIKGEKAKQPFTNEEIPEEYLAMIDELEDEEYLYVYRMKKGSTTMK